MVGRRLGVLIVALAASAGLAYAQFRELGFNEPVRFAPDQMPDRNFTVCRIMYTSVRREPNGGGWRTDFPYGEINLMIRLSELTKTPVSFNDSERPNVWVVRLTDDSLFDCPYTVASDVGTLGLRAEEVDRLRLYLLKGGFLWVDDFWGPWAWDAFTDEIAKALPRGEYPITEITAEHPLYRMLFPIAKIPQVPSMQFWRMSGGATSEMDEYSSNAHMAAIKDKQGRIMVLMTHNTDIADSWEREADDPEFFFNFSPNGYAVGLNAVLYALTH